MGSQHKVKPWPSPCTMQTALGFPRFICRIVAGEGKLRGPDDCCPEEGHNKAIVRAAVEEKKPWPGGKVKSTPRDEHLSELGLRPRNALRHY